MDKSLTVTSMLALFLSLSFAWTASAGSKPLCELVVAGPALENAYVQKTMGPLFQIKSAPVELQEGLTEEGIQAFFPNTSPALLKEKLTMSSGSDLTNENVPAAIEIFSSGLIIQKLEFKRFSVFAWFKDEDEAGESDFPSGQALGYAQENDRAGTQRRFVSIKDKKKSTNLTIGIDVPCEAVGRYTTDFASIRQVKTNAGGLPGIGCRIPILKVRIKKPEVIFPGSVAG